MNTAVWPMLWPLNLESSEVNHSATRFGCVQTLDHVQAILIQIGKEGW